MFTGIIETIGLIKEKKESARNILLTIEPAKKTFLDDVKVGASISVNGVCLTVSENKLTTFTAFAGTETYNITNLKDISSQDPVNLEKSLRLSDRLDGHIVQGHVDNTGIITGVYKINQDYKLEVKIPPALMKYPISKGSIAINGISLTIASIRSNLLSFSIIPVTYEHTNIQQLKTGQKVNIEIDIFAKYIEKFQK